MLEIKKNLIMEVIKVGELVKRNAFFKTSFVTREEGSQKIIEGYFIVYGLETELWEGVYEEIAPGACTNSLIQNDIRALYNHEWGAVLGRKSASTLTMREDEKGVFCTLFINEDDTEAVNVYHRTKRGDITGCSFGFYSNSEDRIMKENGDVKYIVKEADVYEVSVCVLPAYPQTAIQARKKQFHNDEKREFELKKEKIKERLNVKKNEIK